ncbi:MAG TPA: MaoC/PaaZ C-terminal domain-containing protein [Thermomicrobiales bacterium]|jgi:3-hydroxybutyryl-CoA dehydratase|nr:MaoC/PaaZ C-terminal domain-containing protein [Thermomicrobiales bacterium]
MIQGTTIEDIPVGLKAQFSKTVGESDVYLFAGITGDLDPNHVDEEYCKSTPFGHRIAHGALIVGYMSTASTLVLQGFSGPVVSLGYDRIRFVKPVLIGDTVTVNYEIVERDLDRQRTIATVEVTNQRGETVAVATHLQKVL